MKFITIICLTLFSFSFGTEDLNDDLSLALKKGNAEELVKLFSDKLSIKVLAQEDLMSKSQAQAIIADFFSKNKVKNYTPSHTSVVNGDQQFITGTIDTNSGKYRVSILIRSNLISGFRIENE
jgi:hypothetical protein